MVNTDALSFMTKKVPMGLERLAVKTQQESWTPAIMSSFGFVAGAIRRMGVHPGTVARELRGLADYLAFAARYAPGLGRNPRPAKNHGQVVLIVSLTDWPVQIKEEALFAKALQLYGHTPIILTYRRNCPHRAYFALLGLTRYANWDDVLRDVQGAAQAGIEQLRAIPWSSSELMRLRYRGVQIGRHVLSTAIRRCRQGASHLNESAMQRVIVPLMAEAIPAVHAAERVFEQLHPDQVIFLERDYTPYGVLSDAALERGIDVVQWVGAHREDAFTLKRYTADTRDWHPQSLSAATWERVRELPWNAAKEAEFMEELRTSYASGAWFGQQGIQRGKVMRPKREVLLQLGLDPLKKTAVVFSHLLWDATLFYGRDLFDDYEDWLVQTVRAACANTAVNWVVKLHPANVWKLKRDGVRGELIERTIFREQIGELPPHVRLLAPDTDLNTYSLFSIADYCLTVRGTIGIEMAGFGVPTLTAGTGRYSGLGFTIDSASREEYLARLARIQEIPRPSRAQVELAQKYGWTLFTRRLWKLETLRVHHRQPWEDPVVSYGVRSVPALLQAQDLRQFVAWVTSSQALDFLLPVGDGAETMGAAGGSSVSVAQEPARCA